MIKLWGKKKKIPNDAGLSDPTSSTEISTGRWQENKKKKRKQISGWPQAFCFNWKYWNKMFQPCLLLIFRCICNFILSWDEQQVLEEQKSFLEGASSVTSQRPGSADNLGLGSSLEMLVEVKAPSWWLKYTWFILCLWQTICAHLFLPWDGKMHESTCLRCRYVPFPKIKLLILNHDLAPRGRAFLWSDLFSCIS